MIKKIIKILDEINFILTCVWDSVAEMILKGPTL